MKATFKKSYYERNGKYQLKVLVYEYKGKEYEVCVGDVQESLFEQHQKEQRRIDRQIEIETKKQNDTVSAKESFDFFWDYVNN